MAGRSIRQFDRDYRDCYMLIELTDYCNLRCPMCSHILKDGPHSHPQGFMEPALFSRIVAELTPHTKPYALKLFWLGESFLHPSFRSMLKELAAHLEKGFANEYIDLHTNGHFLDAATIDLLFAVGEKLPRLTLSIDAVTEETYSKVRRGGTLEKVEKNIMNFLKRREELDRYFPTLIFQFIVMSENAKEVRQFAEKWGKILDEIALERSIYKKVRRAIANFAHSYYRDVIWFKRVDCSSRLRKRAEELYVQAVLREELRKSETGSYDIVTSLFNQWEQDNQDVSGAGPGENSSTGREGLKAEDENSQTRQTENSEAPEALFYERKKIPWPLRGGRPPCAAPFKTPCIRWDGALSVCCFDPAMQLSLGNLRDSSFEELWYGEEANRIRLHHIYGTIDEIWTHDGFQKCLNCPGYDSPGLEEEEIKAFLETVEGD